MILINNILFYGFVLFTLLCKITAETNGDLQSEKSEVLINLPSRNDLHLYLKSLEGIINFSRKYKSKLNLSFYFGIFLVNVNLKPFLENNSLPESLRNHLEHLVAENSKSLKYFKKKRDIGKIINLMRVDSFWIKRLEKINKKLRPLEEFQNDVHKLYSDWKTYNEVVNDFDKTDPNPVLSDNCLASLSENEENHSDRSQRCNIKKDCYETLLSGSKYGYGLTHRLLFLILARYGRGCTIFSTEEDAIMRDRFNKMIYLEAAYIANNDYKNYDLMLEQMTVSGMDGYVSILRRRWINHFVRYQTPHGCFGNHALSKESLENKGLWRLNQTDNLDEEDPWKGVCEFHMTAVAAGCISAAVRFILENY